MRQTLLELSMIWIPNLRLRARSILPECIETQLEARSCLLGRSRAEVRLSWRPEPDAG